MDEASQNESLNEEGQGKKGRRLVVMALPRDLKFIRGQARMVQNDVAHLSDEHKEREPRLGAHESIGELALGALRVLLRLHGHLEEREKWRRRV